MSKIVWDAQGEHIYETGTDRGVLYVWDETKNTNTGGYGDGVAWNGLTAVTENPSGAEATAIWADNIKYLTLMSAEDFGCTIEAYTYPDEFAECDGSAEIADGVYARQQTRKTFAFCYRTLVGNDTQGTEFGYKIHIVYGCKASPSSKNYTTVNDSPEALQFSWEVTTTPVAVTDFKPTAYIEIDSTKLTTTTQQERLATLEQYLYGRNADTTANPQVTALTPTLLMPDQIAALIENGTTPA